MPSHKARWGLMQAVPVAAKSSPKGWGWSAASRSRCVLYCVPHSDESPRLALSHCSSLISSLVLASQTKASRLVAYQIDNSRKAISRCEELGIATTCQPQHVQEGNVKMVLSLLKMLVHKYDPEYLDARLSNWNSPSLSHDTAHPKHLAGEISWRSSSTPTWAKPK